MKSLKEELNRLSKEGKEIKVTWDGGNDSGSLYVFIGDEELPYGDELEEALTALVDGALDYGSWAGDFTATGEVVYDPEQEAFVGEGEETVSEYYNENCEIKIKVPKDLNFDMISIETTGCLYDDLHISCRLVVNNGPVFYEHTEAESDIENLLLEDITDILSKLSGSIGSVYNDWEIRREEMEEEGDNLIFIIDSLSYEDQQSKEDSHTIPVDDREF